MNENHLIKVRVWGDYACFSRPEFKVERVSYPVMTPSAARGVLEAIFWKPEMRFEVRRIGVLKLGTQTAILRNEIADRQGAKPYFIEDKRQQRSSLILKDVEYLIEADILLRRHATDSIKKYFECFERRLSRGQYHHTPYLGTREFAAAFAPVNDEEPKAYGLQIGTMLFDIAFIEDNRRKELVFKQPAEKKPVPGYARAVFFEAQIKAGWLEVPKKKYLELYKMEGCHV